MEVTITTDQHYSLSFGPPCPAIHSPTEMRFRAFAWTTERAIRFIMKLHLGPNVIITSNELHLPGARVFVLTCSNRSEEEKANLIGSASKSMASTSTEAVMTADQETNPDFVAELENAFLSMPAHIKVKPGSRSGKFIFGSNMLSKFRFTFAPNRCRLLELPVELRYQIIEEILRELTIDGCCSYNFFRSIPSIMQTCKQIFAEGRKLWSNIPLHFPIRCGPLNRWDYMEGMKNIRRIYSPQPRFLVMAVQVLFPLTFSGLSGLDSLIQSYHSMSDVHLNTEFLIGQPNIPGILPPLSGVNVITRLDSLHTVLKRSVNPTPAFCGSALRYNLLSIFSWWSSVDIRSVTELLTFQLRGMIEAHRGCLRNAYRLYLQSIGALLVAIIVYQPEVPSIKITGIGPFLTTFLNLWSAIPNQIDDWKESGNQTNLLLHCLCTWPYPGRAWHVEMVDMGGETSNIRFEPCIGGWFGVSDDEKEWEKRVWQARFKRYTWFFEA
ncbi:hypothetical protein K491DRAFT_694195 [Lophiostoma macrostomum CBS 122681]|uniref:F-box domain-containing protein n=1 Tax=Lophiostoma macrostomum CBS 122681 TaxID=1314788 RepID=A0A6A6T1M9_9PLEO|nr:hypothetical protein K491DRAFT_694195 [Lophiostoma macrostomum CBS 122681]